MNIQFYTSDEFQRQFKHLKKKYKSLTNDIITLRNELIDNPDLGTDLGDGVRKLRMSIASKNKGKSGGGRVITLNVLIEKEPEDELNITFVTIYDKSEIENISDEYIKELINNLRHVSSKGQTP